MAIPKHKMSRSNTRHRRAQWRALPPPLVPVHTQDGMVLVPRRIARAVERGLVNPKVSSCRSGNRCAR